MKHQYMHREKPNLVCLHCNKNFTTESNYRRHINALQNVEKKGYNCGNCGCLFRRLRDLEEHHELKHKDDKVFRCTVCQAEFSWHENLLKHQQVHEVNPHICTVCKHEFIDLTSLLVHRRTHHLPSSSAAAAEPPNKATRMVISQQPETSSSSAADKPFTCHICGRCFRFDFSYQAHLDAHVIPASREMSVNAGQGYESASHFSKPVYVQMDSEGIIDLPAFSSSSNEDVEIIVEVGNVATAGTPVFLQIPIPEKEEDTPNSTTCMKSEIYKNRRTDDGELLRQTSQEVVKTEERRDESSGINENDEDKNTPGSGSAGKNDRDNSTLSKRDEIGEGPPEIDRMDVVDAGKPWAAAVTSFNSCSTKPKKPTKRKRERVPFQFNCVMTDDKPFVCSTCGEAFRWEISLQVHTKAHTEGKVPGVRKIYNSVGAADKRKAMKCKEKVRNSENTTGQPGIKKSRIVYRRESSDEEDVEEDTFAFGNDPEEEASAQVVLSHKKKLSQRRLRPDNADDMLLEYLVGDESFISLEESNENGENEMEDYCPRSEEVVLQNKLKEKEKTLRNKLPDDSWKKGKAILRKKRTWKPLKQRSAGGAAETGALPHSDSADESVCQNEAVQPETQGGGGGGEGFVESLGHCERAGEQSARSLHQQSVIDAGEDKDKKKPGCPQSMVEQGCLDGLCAVDSAAVVADGRGVGSKEVGLNDDRIAMAVAYAAVALPVAEPGLLQNGIIKEEDARAEQRENVMCPLPVAMDTASEQVQNVNACGFIAFSGSLHHQTDRRVDDAMNGGKKSLGEVGLSEPLEIEQNIRVSVSAIPSQSAETEPHKTSAGLTPSQEAETEPHMPSADLIPLQEVETTSAGLALSLGAEIKPHESPDNLTSLQRAEAERRTTSAGLTPSEGDTRISPSQLREKESNATECEFKHDDSCSARISISAENGDHAKGSTGDTWHFSSSQDVSASRIDLESLISSASATPSLPEKRNASSQKDMTLEIIAGNSDPDQILVKDAALKSKYPIKQRNFRQLSSLFQSIKAKCFFKKGLTLKKSYLKKRVAILSNVQKSVQGTIVKRNNCGQCGKHFTSDRSLKRHRIRHRSTLKTLSFKCSHCLKRFSTTTSLDRHLISLHVSCAVVASCETCHKQFMTVDSFTLHQQHGCVFSALETK